MGAEVEREELLRTWLKRARRALVAHYEAETWCRRGAALLEGLPIVATAVAGSIVFLGKQPLSDEAITTVGVLSIVAATLTSLSLHFKLSARAEKHKTFGWRYGAARRQIEEQLALLGDGQTVPVTETRLLLESIAAESPSVPNWIWRRVDKSQQEEASRSPQTSRAD